MTMIKSGKRILWDLSLYEEKASLNLANILIDVETKSFKNQL